MKKASRCKRTTVSLAVLLAGLVLAGAGGVNAQPGARGLAEPVAAVERGVARGKLARSAQDRLVRRLTRDGRVRVIVELRAHDEPFAALTGRQARARAIQSRRRSAIARLQRRLLGRPGLRALARAHRFRDVPFVAVEVDAAALERLTSADEVVGISEDRLLFPILAESAPHIGADLARLQGFGGAGQAVAVLDTGVDVSHPAFAGRVVSQACYSTTNAISGSTTLCPNGDDPGGEDSQVGAGAARNCDDMFGCDHGTHVSGIVLGDDVNYSGIAPEADLIAVQVFSRLDDFLACGFVSPCLSSHTSDLIRGLERVYELRDTHDIAAVNMSIGGEAYTTPESCDEAYPAIKAAIDNLRGAGIVTVVASGNEYHTDAIATPACISSAVSVGATDIIDVVADFSNGAQFLDTLAPGYAIVAPIPGGGYEDKSGTSMAAPHVAGAMAALRSAAPDATPEELLDAVVMTGVPVTDWRSGLITPRVQVDAAADLLTAGELGRIVLALEPQATGLVAPATIAHAGDGSGRLFIAERGGRVVVHDPALGLLATPFLDLSTACCGAGALTGLAFHPGYTGNGLLYVAYDDGIDVVVTRYAVSADPQAADPDSAVEILRIEVPAGSHEGGRLRFGPDGYLYLATGAGPLDGTSPDTAGDPASLLGKVLRIDVDSGAPYAVPPDNPFVGDPGAAEEIWSLGLREPRHFAFDALSGDLYLGDVGLDAAHEIDFQAADAGGGGEDYGWSLMEGSACRGGQACDPSGLTLPVAEYGFDQGCAVTGGDVYRGATESTLYGVYLYGDRCSGRIWGLRADEGVWYDEVLADTPYPIAAIAAGETGEVFVAGSGGGLYRVVVSDLRVASTTLDTAYLDTPYADSLAASGGTPPYVWAVVDGTLPDGLSLDPASGLVSGTPTTPGTWPFTVSLRDVTHAAVERIVRIRVTPPPLVMDTTGLADAFATESYAQPLAASGGTPPYVWSMSGNLPAGLDLDPAGTINGVPSEQGEAAFALTVTDDDGETVTRWLPLTVYGASVPLVLNVTETREFGNGYGTNAHYLGLAATFIASGQDLALHLLGFDIDFVDELTVFLDGQAIGNLNVGPDLGLNAGDAFEIPAPEPGEHRLLIRVKTAGWIWGVTDLLLTDAPLPLVIETTALAPATFGESYTAALVAGGGRRPHTWSVVAGALPPGLALAADGSIAGTPAAQGFYTFTARVTDDLGTSAERELALSAVGASGTVEVVLTVGIVDAGEYGFNFGTGEHPTELYATFTSTGQDLSLHVTGFDIDFIDELAVHLNGELLGHLTMGPNLGLNSGDAFSIRAADQLPGVNQLRFEVKTAGWTWGVTDLLLTGAALPLVITTADLPSATVGESFSTLLEAGGGRTPHVWSVTAGALPPGLALAADGSISGTPTVQGFYPFTARVTDADGVYAEQGFSLSATGASGTVEVALVAGIADTGAYGHNYGTNEHPTDLYASFEGTGQALTLHVTGYDIDFVDELAVYLNGGLLGHLTVGPNLGLTGGDTFEIAASAQQPGTNQLRFRVKTEGWTWGVTGLRISDEALPLAVTTTDVPAASYLVSYAATLQAIGGRAPHVWSVEAGTLPPGLTLADDGFIAGTPAAQGIYAFTARVTDAVGIFAERDFSLSSAGASGTVELVLVPGVVDPGQYGNNFGTNLHPTELYAAFDGAGQDLSLHLTGYDIDFVDELAVYLNGNLLGYLKVGPDVGLNAGDSFPIPAAAQLSGSNQLRFAVKTAGWTWGVTDLHLSDQVLPLVVTTASVPDASFAAGYVTVLEASGGRTPHAWSVFAGALPPGLVLAPDGTIDGTPETQGSFTFTARVTDDDGTVADQVYTLRSVGASGTVEVVLEVGVSDPGEYGASYGSDGHPTVLFATFAGGSGDLTLRVIGYDIDFVDELAVHLNGSLLGYLSVGPNLALNAGDVFSIPSADQLAGQNQLRFEVKTAGWTWGVKDLLLLADVP